MSQLKEYFNNIAQKRLKVRRKNSYYWDDITRYCNYFIHDDYSVIEVGCGNGEMLAQLKGSKKAGIDFSPAMLQNARNNNPGIDFYLMDAENITLDEKFDVVIISNVIGYLDDIQAVFEQLKKLCHRNTKVIVTYYSYLWEPFLKLAEATGLKMETPSQNWLSDADLKNLLDLAGFDTYRMAHRQILPVNIPGVSWLFNTVLARFPLFRQLCISKYAFARPQPDALPDFKKEFTVSVVIPARNESGNIENAILRTPKLGSHTEIIFIEGNSTDDTWEKIQEIQKKYAATHDIKIGQQDGKGKNNAVKKGFAMATGDILMILDADLTMPPEDLPKFYNAIASGKGDFINGSRLVYKMEANAMQFLNVYGNKFFSMMFTWLLERPFKDTLCGTKVIFREDYDRLCSNRKFFGDFDPFGDFDLIFGAFKLNLKIVEIPIRYRERTYGSTNISRFSHGLILLRMVIFAARKIKFY